MLNFIDQNKIETQKKEDNLIIVDPPKIITSYLEKLEGLGQVYKQDTKRIVDSQHDSNHC